MTELDRLEAVMQLLQSIEELYGDEMMPKGYIQLKNTIDGLLHLQNMTVKRAGEPKDVSDKDFKEQQKRWI